MTTTQERATFKPVLGLGGLVLFGITFVGPTAPYAMFGIINTVSRGHLALTYLCAMVAMLLTAISYGRMASAYPVAGSAYTYVRGTMHPLAGFLVGWTMLLDYVLLPLMSVIYMALTMKRFLPGVPHFVWLLLFAGTITGINLFGLKGTNRANFVMTAIMSFSVVWFVVAAIRAVQAGTGQGTLLSIQPFYNPATFEFSAAMAGTSIAAYCYLGFDGVSTLAEDCHNPKRDIARATVLVCLLSGFNFILQAYLGQLAWPDFTKYPNTETAFIDIARLVGGSQLLATVSFVFLVAGFASAVTGQASASRLLVGMGRDRLLPERVFAYIHPKYSTPTYSVLLMGVITVAGGFFLSFQLAAESINFGALLGFMGVNLSVISHYYLKQRERGAAGVWRNLLLPGVGFVVCLYVFLHLSNLAKMIGAVWCTAGVLHISLLMRAERKQGRSSSDIWNRVSGL